MRFALGMDWGGSSWYVSLDTRAPPPLPLGYQRGNKGGRRAVLNAHYCEDMNDRSYALRAIALVGLILGGIIVVIAGIVWATAANRLGGIDPDINGEAGTLPWLAIAGFLISFGLLALFFWLHAESVNSELKLLRQALLPPESAKPTSSVKHQTVERARNDDILPGRKPEATPGQAGPY